MADYKGYTIERGGTNDAVVSPFGEKIVLIVKTLGGESYQSIVEGVRARNNYRHRGEMLEDVVDQYREQIGETDEDPMITPAESRIIVIETVKNLHIHSNELNMQISAEQVEQINVAVEKAHPSVLKRILKEWIPKALVGSGVDELLAMLGLV